MAVSKSLRFQVLRRDNFRCRYCGHTAAESELHVDHVKPTALGGTDTPENLATACADCNRGKAATPADASTVADVAADALRWAAAMAEAGRRINADAAKLNEFLDGFEEAWNDWHLGDDEDVKVPRPDDWRETVKHLRAAGLGQDDFIDAIRIAMNSRARSDNAWRYFCGVCWRKVSDLQETAAAVIAESEAVA